MMKRLFTGRTTFLLVLSILLLIGLTCNTITGDANPGSYPETLIIDEQITYGPGDFQYPDPRAGLADLSSYQARLIITFDGTRDRNALKWTKNYVMLSSNEPRAKQWNIEKSGDISNLEPVFIAEMNGVNYKKRGQDACAINTIREDDTLSQRLEPASFLTGVIGAEEAGSETVNEIPAAHYTFDQRALGEDGITESTGELWVAVDGGYLVKYLLTTKAGSDYFGKGLEGTLTYDYALTSPNQPVEISLPEDCPPGLVDAPMLPDGTVVANLGGVLTYDTVSSVSDATAFYQEKIPSLGWKVDGEPTISETAVYLSYGKGEEDMAIIITANDDGGTRVQVIVGQFQEFELPTE
jgi:hypothetical protein